MGRKVEYAVRVLGRRATGIQVGGDVLGRGLPCNAVGRQARAGGSSAPPSGFRRKAQDLCSLSGPRILVGAAPVWRLVIRTRFPGGTIYTVLTSRAATITSSFSAPADKPIVVSYVRKIIVWFGRDILPWTTGGVNACTLSSFDGQRLVGGEFDALAFSARFLRGFPSALLCLLGRCR